MTGVFFLFGGTQILTFGMDETVFFLIRAQVGIISKSFLESLMKIYPESQLT